MIARGVKCWLVVFGWLSKSQNDPSWAGKRKKRFFKNNFKWISARSTVSQNGRKIVKRHALNPKLGLWLLLGDATLTRMLFMCFSFLLFFSIHMKIYCKPLNYFFSFSSSHTLTNAHILAVVSSSIPRACNTAFFTLFSTTKFKPKMKRQFTTFFCIFTFVHVKIKCMNAVNEFSSEKGIGI